MQAKRAEGVPQQQAQAVVHVASAGQRLEGVVAEVGASQGPVEDLREPEHPGECAVPAGHHEVSFAPRVAGTAQPDREALVVVGRLHPGMMERPGRPHSGDELLSIARNRWA